MTKKLSAFITFVILFGAILLARAEAAGIGVSAAPVTFPNITGSTQCLHVNSAGVVSGVGSDCASGTVTLAGTNAFTGTNSWASLSKFSYNPAISSGGSATDGAVCFGKTAGVIDCNGSSTRFVNYDVTLGGTGGYALGNTFTAADTLYSAEHAIVSPGATRSVTFAPPASGSSWRIVLPTSRGTNGQVWTSDGAGGSSWTAPSAGTFANPSATAGPAAINGSASTYMRSDAAPLIQKGSNAQFGLVEGDTSTVSITAGVASVTNPIGPATVAGGYLYFTLPGGYYLETGGSSTGGGGSTTVTLPHNLAVGFTSIIATAQASAGVRVMSYNGCVIGPPSTCTFYAVDGSGTPQPINFTWTIIGQ